MTSSYLSEEVLYGGILTTRGAMITDLQRVAATWTDDPRQQQAMVSRYLQGFERFENQ